jgi:hypothetical protein
VACMAVAVCSIGVPLPAFSVKHAAEPYPCEHCACGCVDAETCWRHCCCYTNAEKLAWAKRNGVTPPMFVVAAAKRERCCAGQHAANDGESGACHAATCHRPCCARRAKTACGEESPPTVARKSRDQLVWMVSALRCRGLSMSVSMLPPSLPLKACVKRALPSGPTEPVGLANTLYESPALPVASPPPKALSA